MEALSALVDDELAAPARAEIETHALSCPVCGAALADLNALRARFAALPELRVGFDLAPAIADRIRVAERALRARPARERLRWWQAFPAALGAAASLSAGAYVGSFLVVGGGAVASPAAIEMSVFDAVPPGGICLGPACGGGR
jgi:anti-sigma factor RsiW